MLFLFPFQAMAEKQLLHSQSTRCGECGKAFLSSSNRDRHVQQSHRGLRPFRCGEEACQKTFARKEGLTLHRGSAHRQGSSQESDSDSNTGHFKRSSRIVDDRIIIRKQRPEVRETGLQAQRTLLWNEIYITQSASDPRPPMGDPVIDLTKETPSATPDSGVDSEEDPYRRRELKRRRAARERRHHEREDREYREKIARKGDPPAPARAASPRSAPDVSTPDVAAASPVAAEAPAAVPDAASVPVPAPDLPAAAPAPTIESAAEAPAAPAPEYPAAPVLRDAPSPMAFQAPASRDAADSVAPPAPVSWDSDAATPTTPQMGHTDRATLGPAPNITVSLADAGSSLTIVHLSVTLVRETTTKRFQGGELVEETIVREFQPLSG